MATFHFFTLVTKDAQYDAMRASLTALGFDPVSMYTVLDNRAGNAHEPYSAITQAVKDAQAPYVVFCHQDLVFQLGPDVLLDALEALDPTWAVAGNAGITPGCEPVFCIDDHAGHQDLGVRPAKVLTLDENLLVIRRDAGVGCSPELSGFHLYGTDLCLNAYRAGRTAHVVEYRLTHASSSLDYGGLFAQARSFVRFWGPQLGGTVLRTATMVLFFTRWGAFDAAMVRGPVSSRLWNRPATLRLLNRLMRPRRPKWLPL